MIPEVSTFLISFEHWSSIYRQPRRKGLLKRAMADKNLTTV